MTELEFMEKLDVFIAANERAYVKNLSLLVAINSVEGVPAANTPFGEAPRKALSIALNMAKEMGLAVNDGDGFVGWAELPGQSEGHIATITHLDIVPAGSGWNSNPFDMQERDGWLIGRGTSDDKGPSLLCLYVANFLKELGTPLRYGLRVLLGCNEETGMRDVGCYLKQNPEPLFAFSPDASFPVCNGEKGGFSGKFVSLPLAGNITAFSGGVARNVIPDRATCTLKLVGKAPAGTANVEVSVENGLINLFASGIGGHAAHPEGTLNAIGLLVDFLLANKLCTPEENTYLQLLQKLHSASDGSGLGIACADAIFDALTCIGGTISFEDARLRQCIDIRFPTSTTGAALNSSLLAQAENHASTFENMTANEPFYISPDAPAVQTLLKAYNDVTKDNGKPFTMGGGTYARHFKNAVSFGPEISGETIPEFIGTIHGANEGVSLAAMMRALKIYALAIWRLQQVELV